MRDSYNSACLINMTNCISYVDKQWTLVTFYRYNVSFGCYEFRLLLYIAYFVVNGLWCHMTTLNFGVIIKFDISISCSSTLNFSLKDRWLKVMLIEGLQRRTEPRLHGHRGLHDRSKGPHLSPDPRPPRVERAESPDPLPPEGKTSGKVRRVCGPG